MKSRQRWLIVFVAFALCINNAPISLAEQGSSNPERIKEMPVADLVKEVRAAERWIWTANSFLLRADVTSSPTKDKSFVVAWDANRAMIEQDREDYYKKQSFDPLAKLLTSHFVAHDRDNEYYAFQGPSAKFDTLYGMLPFGRMTQPRAWWAPEKTIFGNEVDIAKFTDRGVREHAGNSFRVLETPQFHEYWVALNGGRLARIVWKSTRFVNPGEPAVPMVEWTFADWRNVTEGHVFPYEITYTNYGTDKQSARQITNIRRYNVKEIIIDTELPANIFNIKLREEVEVHDFRNGLLLVYPYKTKFSDEEWQTLVKEGESRKKDREEYDRTRREMTGQPAPALQANRWFQGGAQNLAGLKGRYVIIDFFADWCGPCRSEYEKLVEASKRFDPERVSIIGVHPEGSKDESIRRLLDEYGIQYGVMIDDATKDSYWGSTFAAYKIKGIPAAVLIGPDGNILEYGRVDEAINLLKNRLR